MASAYDVGESTEERPVTREIYFQVSRYRGKPEHPERRDNAPIYS